MELSLFTLLINTAILIVQAIGEQNISGGLKWCSTLCMCDYRVPDQLHCFEREDLYDLLEFSAKDKFRLLKSNFKVEAKYELCGDYCLCYKGRQTQFKCATPENLEQFISNIQQKIPVVEEPQETHDYADEDGKNKTRREERRRNRKHRKNKKKEKSAVQEEPDHELIGIQLQEIDQTTEPTTNTPRQWTTTVPGSYSEDTETNTDMDAIPTVELLPQQEAIAASPAVTAQQPPTRRQPQQPLPPPRPSNGRPRQETLPKPKVSPVLEVPLERKTVAGEVSQDLENLSGDVRQIKGDVLLNQRILLVTVAVAAIAMLGVVILALHMCCSKKNSATKSSPVESPKQRRANEENHVTKVDNPDAW